jgi:hypothetical protein
MRRLGLLLVTLGVLAAVAAIAWRWWTAPPRADAGALVLALAVAPADADGALALAQPTRAARWLAAHPQALALVGLAAPAAERSLPRIRGFVLALATKARGPVTVWWRGAELAAGAEVGAGAVSTLRRLAALEALPLRANPATGGAVTVSVATAAEILGAGETLPGPRVEPGSLAALARCGGHLWRARAGRSTLEVVTGAATTLPGETGPETIITSDLAALLSPVVPAGWLPRAPARLLFDSGGWAVQLPATALPNEVRALLALGGDAAAASPPGARHWRGVLGDIWVLPGAGLSIASRPDLLAELPQGTVEGESGNVRGEDLAHVVGRVAAAADGIPGSAGFVRGLHRAVAVLAGVRRARWRLVTQGGRIALEW